MIAHAGCTQTVHLYCSMTAISAAASGTTAASGTGAAAAAAAHAHTHAPALAPAAPAAPDRARDYGTVHKKGNKTVCFLDILHTV